MKDLTFRQLQAYLLEHYQQSRTEEGLFIKLVEEVGEVAEVLNGRSGRKKGVQDSNEELAKELADIIHYTVAIAAINDIDLTKTIFEKDKKAAIKYQHERDLEEFLEYHLDLDQSDVGRVIGRKGRTISAIRTIVYSVPTEDKKVRIVIDEK